MKNEFRTTLNIFSEYLHYNRPLSYEEWLHVSDDNKAAVLYCQFFNEIELAWYKSKSFYASEQEGVETVMQYLMKNVPLLVKDSKKFKPGYVYRVAYNCLYCISHDRVIDRNRFELEISNIAYDDNNETSLDLFDTVYNDDDIKEYDLHSKALSKRFWAMIENLDLDTQGVIANILKEDKLPKGMSWKRKREILDNLKDLMTKTGWKDVYYK